MRPSTLPKPHDDGVGGRPVLAVGAGGEAHLGAVHADLEEHAVVEERREPLARGQLAARVLLRDLVRRRPSRAPPRGAPRGPPPARACSWRVLISRSSSGGRFSRNAVSPSRASSVARHSAEALAQERQRRLEIEVVLRGEGLEAEAHRRRGSCRGCASVSCCDRARRARPGRPRGSTRPMRAASSASSFSPRSIISSRRRRGTTRARTAMIIIGKSPTSISGVPSLRAARRDREVRRRDEPEPAAHRVRRSRARRWASRARHREEQVGVVALRRQRVAAAGAARHLREVAAGAERVALAGEHDDAHRRRRPRASSSARSSSLIIARPDRVPAAPGC